MASTGDNTVRILLGDGDGTFTESTMFTVGASPVAIVSGDVNNDGLADLVTANQVDGNVSLILTGA